MSVKNSFLILLLIFTVGIIAFITWGIDTNNYQFFLPRRFSRFLTILVVAYSTGYSAVVFQTITNNRILTPSIMGFDSLYLFIQTFVVFFWGSKSLVMISEIREFSISVIFMILSSLIVYKLIFKGTNKNIYFLVLTGIVLGRLFDGMATFMQVLLDPNEFDILQGKMFASLNSSNNNLLYICLLVSLIIILISFKDFNKLDVLALGEDQAINLGLNYKKFVKKILIIISVLTSISIALIGPITFLGILCVSIARQILNSYRHIYMSMAAVLIANIALIYALIIFERLFNNTITISILVNFLGSLIFIYLILKESKYD